MAKKSTRAKAQDHQEAKLPSIEDAREKMSQSMIEWAWYLTPFDNGREKEMDASYLEAIMRNHHVLIAFEHSQTEQFSDPILHLRTHWLNMRAIDIVGGIGATLFRITYSKEKSLSKVSDVVECVREYGLPSRHYEALSIFDLVNDAMKSKGIKGEKYPGLRMMYREMSTKGSVTDGIVASAYVKRIGYQRGVTVETIKNYIHNHKREWFD